MATAPTTTTEKKTRPAKSAAAVALANQRILVYSVTALLCLIGMALIVAFKDPCPTPTQQQLQLRLAKCVPRFVDRLPGQDALICFGVIQTAMIVLYELRWLVRVYVIGAIGAAIAVCGVVAVADGMSAVLMTMCLLIGGGLVLAAVAIQREQRIGWAFAAAITGTLGVVLFFAASKIAGVADTSLPIAVLPSLAIMMPATVMLATTPPGKPRPGATSPGAARPGKA